MSEPIPDITPAKYGEPPEVDTLETGTETAAGEAGGFSSAAALGGLKKYTMVIALVALLVFFHIASGGKMVTSSNMQNLIQGNAHVLILAMGMLMVIVIGQIDLSVGPTAGLVGLITAISARDLPIPWWVAALIGLAVGIAVGCWQGFWLAKMGIPGFITTLAGLLGFRGAIIWISGSVSIPAPTELRSIASGYLPDWGRSALGMNGPTLVLGALGIAAVGYFSLASRQRQLKLAGSADPLWSVWLRIGLLSAGIAFASYLFASGREGTSFPIIGIILLVLIFVYHIVTERTPFGRHVYAVGGNRAAAALTGINVPRTYFFTMLNMSFLAAIAGLLFVGRATSAAPAMGTGWELDAIASVFIGGAAVSGGIGTIFGTITGAMVMAVLNSGLMALGVSSDKTAVIKGLVLLVAVAFDVYNKQQGRKSIIGHLTKHNQGSENAATKEVVTEQPIA
ncbi:MAG: sugar ABC transporter permease [Propionibacteriaceae bacterium]|jgi:putative multiple sugar transport system permease protein|nr:sugar ABC transporter permease [Propionibacteriaceae bacterium]